MPDNQVRAECGTTPQDCVCWRYVLPNGFRLPTASTARRMLAMLDASIGAASIRRSANTDVPPLARGHNRRERALDSSRQRTGLQRRGRVNKVDEQVVWDVLRDIGSTLFQWAAFASAAWGVFSLIYFVWERYRTKCTLHIYKCDANQSKHHWVVRRNGRPILRGGCGEEPVEIAEHQYDSRAEAERAASNACKRRLRIVDTSFEVRPKPQCHDQPPQHRQ